MKHRVYRTHCIREMEGEGVCAYSSNDLIWSEVSLGELPGWPGCLEELCLHICLAANLEIRGWQATCICRHLVAGLDLFDVFFQCLVQLIKIYCKVACSGGCKVPSWVDCKVQVVSLVHIKW